MVCQTDSEKEGERKWGGKEGSESVRYSVKYEDKLKVNVEVKLREVNSTTLYIRGCVNSPPWTEIGGGNHATF